MELRVIFLDEVHPILEQRLVKLGYQCEKGYTCDRNSLISKIHNYSGIVVRGRIRMNSELLDLASNLKFIARSGAGMENIDVPYAESKGIKCFNAPEGNRTAVAEHAIGMLLSLFNKIPSSREEVRKGLWRREENRGVEIEGKKVGIIGFGNTGKALATRLMGFKCELMAFDKYESVDMNGVKEVTLYQLQRDCEIISFHVPLTEETRHYFNDDFLENCKKEVYIINTSRGSVLKNSSLVKGLKENLVKGACLDVLENEKFSFENLEAPEDEDLKYLLESEKVIITPHVAGWTHESYVKLSSILADKIESEFH